MCEAFFTHTNTIFPATHANTSSTIFRHPLPSNAHLLSLTNKWRQLPLQLVKTHIQSSNNFAFDIKGGKGISRFHEFELSVRDYELDQYGVVNNAVFANYCQHAHRQLMNKIGINIDTIAENGNAIALSELSLKYLAPLRIGDRFTMRVRVSESSSTRVYIEHFINKIPNQEPILEARSTVVWLNKNYRPIRIPADVKSKLAQFLRHDYSI